MGCFPPRRRAPAYGRARRTGSDTVSLTAEFARTGSGSKVVKHKMHDSEEFLPLIARSACRYLGHGTRDQRGPGSGIRLER
jgi:hypothetical protein